MKRSYTFEEAFELDRNLQKLAIYEVSKGKIVIPKSNQELLDFEVECAEKFNEFKGLIRRGECTVEYLRDTVLFKNGAYNQNDEYISTPEELLEDMKASEIRKQNYDALSNGLYNSIIDILKMKGIDTDATRTTKENIDEDFDGRSDDLNQTDG